MLLETLDSQIQVAVQRALAEDVGSGDITAELIPDDKQTVARLISREDGVLCGTSWFNATFWELDPSIVINWVSNDGNLITPNQTICTISGASRPLLTGERTALNFLQTLSGVATISRAYANAIREYPSIKILDTRKTIPGLRAAQKYAVVTGGCHNHRIGLFDGVLIKENHIDAAGSISKAVQAAKAANRQVPIEVEVETMDQFSEAINAGADILLLDNFNIEQLRDAVTVNSGRVKLEASGGINLDNIEEVASTGVDYISIGTLTKNVRALDLSMRFESQE